GMAEDLLETIGQLFGPLRGGLALAVVFVGALLAATTGVVAASVISMGLISLPIMLRYGYDRRLATGVIAASGTLAQIIPPSLVLIILADQLGRSVGDMYKGAFLPGFLLMGMYAAYVVLIAVLKPSRAPALPPEARTLREPNGASGMLSLGVLTSICAAVAIYYAQNFERVQSFITGTMVTTVATDEVIVVSLTAAVILALLVAVINRVTGLGLLSRMAERVTFVLIPPLLLMFLVLGTIFLGVATPTEGGAMGALGALILASVRGRITLSLLKQALTSTTRLSCFVIFILIGSTIFSLTFQGVDGPRWVEHLLADLPGGQLGFLILVNLLIFFLAFFLDFFELSFIVVPLLAPVAEKLGIDLVWFGVLLAVNMQTSFMHPPFGFALFYLRSVAPTDEYTDRITKQRIAPVKSTDIYWGAVPFVFIQIVMVALIIAFPALVSSGIGKKPVYDLDKVRREMEATMRAAEPPPMPEPPTAPSIPANGGTGAAPVPEPSSGIPESADDPMKALMNSMQDAAKK
ncbi:MAG: TRAP transporter large permease subunit, partial [Burkholderiaceae bacterium]